MTNTKSLALMSAGSVLFIIAYYLFSKGYAGGPISVAPYYAYFAPLAIWGAVFIILGWITQIRSTSPNDKTSTE